MVNHGYLQVSSYIALMVQSLASITLRRTTMVINPQTWLISNTAQLEFGSLEPPSSMTELRLVLCWLYVWLSSLQYQPLLGLGSRHPTTSATSPATCVPRVVPRFLRHRPSPESGGWVTPRSYQRFSQRKYRSKWQVKGGIFSAKYEKHYLNCCITLL